jgi:sugar phosphate isomerase/epimerase
LDAVGELSPDQLSQSGRREIRAILRSLNLELTAVYCPLRRGLDTATDLEPRIERIKKVMSLTYDLGARITIVPLPPIPRESEDKPPSLGVSAGGILLGRSPRRESPDVVLREALGDLGAHGDRIGTLLALDAGVDPPEKLAAYLGSFDTGALHLHFDPANYLSHGHDPMMAVACLSNRIVHVQAREVRRGASGQFVEVPLGAGDIDWMTLIAVLDSTGYRGWVVVKRTEGADRLGDLRQGLEILRRFIRQS